MWLPVQIENDPSGRWYVMHVRNRLVCGPVGDKAAAEDWCRRKDLGESVPVLPRAPTPTFGEPSDRADAPHVVQEQ